jgi:hypothetical protein
VGVPPQNVKGCKLVQFRKPYQESIQCWSAVKNLTLFLQTTSCKLNLGPITSS